MQTGAVKKTEITGEYMHVVCAMWNKSIQNEIEPYHFNSSQLNLHVSANQNVNKEMIIQNILQDCCFCHKTTGLCIKCDTPDCKT
jgi:hypothetical protein